MRFKINDENIIHEIIEGEAVLVDLESGTYFSTDKVGAEIWRLIDDNQSVGEIVDALETRYEADRGNIEASVNRLVEEMHQEGLILPVEPRAVFSEGQPENGADSTVERTAFEEPVLHKYTDMVDLLLLDPIHEVDEAGWPHQKEERG